MNKSETIVNLAIALTKAQAEWPAIGRDATGFNNKYAPLDKVLAAVRPVLAKHELSFVQTPGTSDHIDQIVLTSMLVHSSGEFLEETMTMPVPQVGKSNAAQCYGAGLTYARRYSLEAFLGIASTEDTDGASGGQAKRKHSPHPAPVEPLPDDEQVIYEGEAGDFWANVLALIDRYTAVQHAHNAAKNLGYTAVPGTGQARLEMYRALKAEAAKRDIEEIEVEKK